MRLRRTPALIPEVPGSISSVPRKCCGGPYNRAVAPSVPERGFGLGISHDPSWLGGVVFPPRIYRLRLHGLRTWRGRRSRPCRCLSVAPETVRRSLGGAGTGSATSRAATRRERSAAAEAFALGGHLAGFAPGQFAGQASSTISRTGASLTPL